MYGVDDNNEVGTMAVVMVVIRPVEQQKSVVVEFCCIATYLLRSNISDERSINTAIEPVLAYSLAVVLSDILQ